MPISVVGSGASLPLAAVVRPGQPADPAAQRAQVNAQADLLRAMQDSGLSLKMVAARVSDKVGVDLYL